MKALEQMNNVERGYLFAGLFPEEIPGILNMIRERYAYLQTHAETIRNDWENSMLTADFWYNIAGRVHRAVEKYESKLIERRRLFADQLFNGHNAFFTIDCIVKYARRGGGGPRFQGAVKMFFCYNP